MRTFTLSLLTLLPLILFGQKQVPLDIALRYIEQNHVGKWSLTEGDISGMVVSDQYRTEHNGATHIYFNQQHAGIPVYNAILGVHISAQGKVAYAGSRFVSRLAERVNLTQPALAAQEAVRRAAAHLGTPAPASLRIVGTQGKSTIVFDGEGLSRGPIVVRLMYQPLNDGRVLLAWDLAIEELRSPDYWSLRIDAQNGEVLDQNNFTSHCRAGGTAGHLHQSDCFEQGRAPLTGSAQPLKAALAKAHAAPPAGAVYHVFPFPLESPAMGQRQLLNNPADSIASPFGWHDVDGQAGPEYTFTRGNNVHSFADPDDKDVTSNDEPNGGPELQFDFPFDSSQEPEKYREAATTQLFYLNNVLHDFSYHYGFDEVAGNFQQNNYNKGGLGADAVQANAQDGGDVNNANFTAPADGRRGRMQMYLWGDTRENLLKVDAPEEIKGSYEVSTADFGPAVTETAIKGRVVEALDGTSDPAKGCKAIVNSAKVRGNIALIDRGVCFFEEKARNAEIAGAIGVIICNFEESLVGMGNIASVADPRIPTIMMRASDCQRIRNFLSKGVDITLQREQAPSPEKLDGSFDNGIVAHEFGHGISTRLTGGPNQSGCLANDEQMGEGWSDFFTLVTTYQPGQTGIVPRGIGSYVIRSQPTSAGVRRLPYSTDFSVNASTYDDIIGTTTPHSLGETWTLMLWDMYWKLVDVYGWDDDLYQGKGGNNIAIQLVMDGMKIQNCSPGFIDGRDAIIAADLISNDGQNECLLWEVFARRGLGWSADQGNSKNRNDGFQAFDVKPECIKKLKIEKSATPLIAPGDEITYTLIVTNHKEGTVSDVMINDALPAGVTFIAGSTQGAQAPAQEGRSLLFELGDMAPGDSKEISYRVKSDATRRSIRQFFDDIEAGDNNWIFENLEGLDIWEISDKDPYSGKYSWYIPNTTADNDQVLQLLDPIRISGTQPTLRFYHRYSTQPGTDGGVVEVSKDGGATWTRVPKDQIFRNTYRGRLSYQTFALTGVDAFWGDSKQYMSSYIDLSPYQGEEISLRFRFGSVINVTTDTTAGAGWFVDNIEIMDLYTYQSEACVTSKEGDRNCAVAPGRGTAVEAAEFTDVFDPVAGRLDMRVYPNPANDWINVAIRSANPADASIELLSLDGRVLQQTPTRLVGDEQIVPVRAGQLPAGVYLVRLLTEHSVTVKKVVIE